MELYERVAEKLGWKWLDESGPVQWCLLPGEHADYEGYVAMGTGDAMLAMLEAMRERGWYTEIYGDKDQGWMVEIEGHERNASTLPEAVARAVDAAL